MTETKSSLGFGDTQHHMPRGYFYNKFYLQALFDRILTISQGVWGLGFLGLGFGLWLVGFMG